MNEEFVFFERASGCPTEIQLAGISRCDPTYHIKRAAASIYVFEYVLKGTGVVWHNREQFRPAAGDVYILKKGAYHEYYSDKHNPFEKVWFNISGSYVEHLLSDFHLGSIQYIKDFGDPTLFFDILEAGRDKSKTPAEIMDEVNLLLLRLIISLKRHTAPYADINRDAFRVKQFIDDHIYESIDIAAMSRLIYRSPSRTSQIFKKAFGKTPYEYALSTKLLKAASLLQSADIPIKEISDMFSFCEPSYFSSLFKQRYGASPKYYRLGKSEHVITSK